MYTNRGNLIKYFVKTHKKQTATITILITLAYLQLLTNTDIIVSNLDIRLTIKNLLDILLKLQN